MQIYANNAHRKHRNITEAVRDAHILTLGTSKPGLHVKSKSLLTGTRLSTVLIPVLPLGLFKQIFDSIVNYERTYYNKLDRSG